MHEFAETQAKTAEMIADAPDFSKNNKPKKKAPAKTQPKPRQTLPDSVLKSLKKRRSK